MAIAPRDAAQIDGIKQQSADVDVLASRIGGDLPGDLRLDASGRPPDDGRLARLHQECESVGELARAQQVVGGDVVGAGHGGLRTGVRIQARARTERPSATRPSP